MNILQNSMRMSTNRAAVSCEMDYTGNTFKL